MDDKQNNLIDCFRVRLTFLDDPANTPVWQGNPPIKFTQKAALAKTQLAEIDDVGGRQSLRITGAAADKDREETDLENTAHTMARAIVIFAHDSHNETLAAKYDLPFRAWSRLRDEQLLEKCRQLKTDAAAFSNDEEAQTHGITPAAVKKLSDAIDTYERFISAPTIGISERKALTARLKTELRELKRLFDQLDGLSLQFRGTPEGDKFVRKWLATAQIIDRGHGPKEEDPKPTPGPTL
ncbi:MAG TPA: hypothetical protein VM511_09860 [Luteolibacter sp.]|nr:hypothetical protein [Luteolibacter sp.]